MGLKNGDSPDSSEHCEPAEGAPSLPRASPVLCQDLYSQDNTSPAKACLISPSALRPMLWFKYGLPPSKTHVEVVIIFLKTSLMLAYINITKGVHYDNSTDV
jgi:hypothetical protein